MSNDVKKTGGSDIRDRKTGLVVFGIFEILLGVFIALMVPVMIFGLAVSSALAKGSASSVSAGTMIPALLFYVLLATWFIWMGIGSIQARRWARALLLVTSWYWLISGVMALVFMLGFLSDMYDQMGKSGQMPRQIAAVMKYVMIGFVAVFHIIIPGVFVLFYGSRHTKATCEHRDTRIRWTDKCPLQVLAVSLMSGCGAVCMPLMGFYGWVIPFFGFILTGFVGAVVALVTSVLLGYVAWGMYRSSVKAWWCAVVMMTAWGVSCCVTVSQVNLMDVYKKMNLPDQQLEVMKQFPFFSGHSMVLFCGVWVVAVLAYLVYARKYLSWQENGNPVTEATHIVEPVQPPRLPQLPQTGAPSGGLAITSCVLGVIAVLLGIFVIGGVLGIFGLILGVIHLMRSRSHRSLAGWGVGMSIVGSLLAAIVLIVCIKAFKSLPSLGPQQRYAQAVRELSDPTTPEIKRFYALNGAAKEAFNLGMKEQARKYAEEQSRMLDQYKKDWNYGNAVQDINIVLGRIAVSEGELEKAKEYLLKAGDSPGSPQMNSFGPNMSLAKDLLEKGEKHAVIQYFSKCAAFWKMDHGSLDAWAKQVKSGQIPDFGANLLY